MDWEKMDPMDQAFQRGKKKMSVVGVRKLAVRRLWSEHRRLGFMMKLWMVNIWGVTGIGWLKQHGGDGY